MSRLVSFYRGAATDSERRKLDDILSWDDDDLEAVHDFIQWLFPLPEPSQFNADASLVDEDDIEEFKRDKFLRANLGRSFARILRFLGLTRTDNGEVLEGGNFQARARDVWAAPNHNWLRLTRILRSLKLLGLEAEAEALYGRLNAFYTGKRFPIPADTFRYWTQAVRGEMPRG